MPGFQIPTKTSSSAAATSFDGAYQAFSGRMLLFNAPNAFSYNAGARYSQGKFGVGELVSRASQNNAWNTAYAASIFSGSGALSCYAKTYTFANKVGTIDGGRVMAGLLMDNAFHTAYNAPTKALITSIDEVNNAIGGVAGGSYFPASMADKRNQKSYIATSPNGTKFLIVGGEGSVRTFQLDANKMPISATATSTVTYSSFPASPATAGFGWLNYANVIAAKGAYVWVVCVDTGYDATTNSVNKDAACSGRVMGYLYSIDNAGALTLVGSPANVYAQFSVTSASGMSGNSSSGGRYYSSGSYVKNNTAYCYADFYAYYRDSYGTTYPIGTVGLQQYFTVNLSTTTAFTFTSLNAQTINQSANNSVANTTPYNTATGETPVGYNGTNMYFVLATGAIWYNTGSGWNNASLTSAAGANNNMLRYRNTTTKLSTATANTFFNNANTGLVIDNVTQTGTIANSGTQAIFVYEMTGTNEEDDAGAFTGILCDFPATRRYDAITESLSLYMNDVLMETKTLTFAAAYAGAINTALPTFTQQTATAFTSLTAANPINATTLEFKLEALNPNARNLKLGFGLTGGTYASPTGANNFTGTSTTAWTVNANSTYVDLTLA